MKKGWDYLSCLNLLKADTSSVTVTVAHLSEVFMNYQTTFFSDVTGKHLIKMLNASVWEIKKKKMLAFILINLPVWKFCRCKIFKGRTITAIEV